MKSMGIHNILNFPFPTPPPPTSLKKGIDLLKYLGALGTNDEVTDLGRRMSLFPLTPRFAKIILIANQFGCLPYVIALVAALSIGDPFISSAELGIDGPEDLNDNEDQTTYDQEARKQLRSKYNTVQSMFASINGVNGCPGDAFKILSAVCRYDWEADRDQFAKNHFLRFKLMEEIRKLRKQLSYIVAINTQPESVDKCQATLDTRLGPPSSQQVTAIRQMIAAGFIDQVAIRADLLALDTHIKSGTRISAYPYKTLFPIQPIGSLRGEIDPFVYIHPNSVLVQTGGVPPSYLIYSSVHLSESHKSSLAVPQKVRMKVLCDITANELSNVSRVSTLLTYSKPLGAPYAPRNISPTKRECWVVPRFGAAIGSGGVGWDLPPKKVVQEKEGLQWVVKS
jgi:ATP-dependent RNA helicase DHX37/DHR1